MLRKLLLALALVFAGAVFAPQKADAAFFGPGAAGVEQAAPAAVEKAQYYYRRRFYRPRYFVRRYYRPRYYRPRYFVRRYYRPRYYRRYY